MKKITLISLFTTLSCSAIVHAGCMGGCSNSQGNNGAAFFAIEGGYAQNDIDGYNFTITPAFGTITSTDDNQNYLLRLSAGMMASLDDQVAVSGEMGWGYYGKTTLTPVFAGSTAGIFAPGSLNTSYSLNGFDALVGLIYTQPSFNLYLKVGALVENMKIESNSNFSAFNPSENVTSTTNVTAVLPEVKIGAAYNFSENWALTVSGVYAFGSNTGVSGSFNSTSGNSSLIIKEENPTISAAMVGLQYTV